MFITLHLNFYIFFKSRLPQLRDVVTSKYIHNTKELLLTVSIYSPTGPDSPSLEFKELLKNEKSNFKLVNSAVSFLGGVPAMINPADMSNTIPNEKVRPGGRCVIACRNTEHCFW